jgi:hypothetical protein
MIYLIATLVGIVVGMISIVIGIVFRKKLTPWLVYLFIVLGCAVTIICLCFALPLCYVLFGIGQQ